MERCRPYSRTPPPPAELPAVLKTIDVRKATKANLKSCRKPGMPIKELRNLLFGLFDQSKEMRDQLVRWFHDRTGEHRYEYRIVTIISDTEVCVMKFNFNKPACTAARESASDVRLSSMYTFCKRTPTASKTKTDN